MIDLYYAPTPNGWKISIMLEELGLPYNVIPVNIRTGEQFEPDFLKISPNNRIPAIIDQAPADGLEPIPMFETGAILIYLAEKTGRFLPKDVRGRFKVIQWVMWQMGGLGPMLGQHGHFALYATEKIPYAIQRYRDEAERLYAVLDRQLGKTGAYVAGDEYSIADIAIFPWTMTHKAQGFTLDDFPNIKRWYAAVRARPEVQRGWRWASSTRHLSPTSSARTCSAKPRSRRSKDNKRHNRKRTHDRILFRLLQPVDLSRLHQHPADGEGAWRADHMAAHSGRRYFQHRQQDDVRDARQSGARETGLYREGHAGLGAAGGHQDHHAADGIPGECGEVDARLHLGPADRAGQTDSVRDSGVRGLLG
jgi:GST-like protein